MAEPRKAWCKKCGDDWPTTYDSDFNRVLAAGCRNCRANYEDFRTFDFNEVKELHQKLLDEHREFDRKYPGREKCDLPSPAEQRWARGEWP